MSQKWHENLVVQEIASNVGYAHLHAPAELGGSTKLAGTFAYGYHQGEFIVAVAMVSPRDNGSRKIGRDISRGRLLRAVAQREGLVEPTTPYFGFGDELLLRQFIAVAKEEALNPEAAEDVSLNE